MNAIAELQPGRSRPTLVVGAHKTITPCALPPWLPSAIIARLVKEFSKKLDDMLTIIKEKEMAFDKRTAPSQPADLEGYGYDYSSHSEDTHPQVLSISGLESDLFFPDVSWL